MTVLVTGGDCLFTAAAKYPSFFHVLTLSAVQFEKAAANTPICPKTGQKIEIALTDVPGPKWQEKCDALVVEIQSIQAKLSKY